MNWLDIALAAILAVSIISGLRKGFAKIGIGLIATVVAVVLGAWYYDAVAAFLTPYVSSRAVAAFLGFLLIFSLVMLAGSLLARLLAKLFKWIGLSWFDRFMGGVIGFVRGVLLSVVLLMVLIAFSPGAPPASVVESRLAPHLIEAAGVLAAITPKEMKTGFRDGYDKVKKAWVDSFEKGLKRPQEKPAEDTRKPSEKEK